MPYLTHAYSSSGRIHLYYSEFFHHRHFSSVSDKLVLQMVPTNIGKHILLIPESCKMWNVHKWDLRTDFFIRPVGEWDPRSLVQLVFLLQQGKVKMTHFGTWAHMRMMSVFVLSQSTMIFTTGIRPWLVRICSLSKRLFSLWTEGLVCTLPSESESISVRQHQVNQKPEAHPSVIPLPPQSDVGLKQRFRGTELSACLISSKACLWDRIF